MKKNLFLLICILLLSSCLNEEQTAALATFEIQATLPEDCVDIDMTKIVVKIQNKDFPVVYQKNLDADGKVGFLIESGRYSATISSRTVDGIFNSLCSEFILTNSGILNTEQGGLSNVLTMKLEVAAPGGLIFREIYYVGSKTSLGTSYLKDQYFELYNNTADTFFLDSLCIGGIFPVNTTGTNFSWQGKDTIALFQMVWRIPGAGHDYPLGPGKSAVIAMNAVDHTGLGSSNLNMSKAHFGFYDPLLAGHEKHPDVPALIRIVVGQGTAYSISVGSPALVIFRPAMGVQAYLNNRAKWERYQPGTSSGTKYWHIAKEWILDGVECSTGTTINIKRLPVAIDAGFAYTEGNNSGLAIRRKVEQVLPDNRIIYQDTNNSSVDFEINVTPAPRLKP